mmetsp:Transcript_102448/g.296329  ORF Transcript_102448/g.296329 Transcript_102448/m.296329 type:complete len:212 (-) Transcript_102448:209-844(-)
MKGFVDPPSDVGAAAANGFVVPFAGDAVELEAEYGRGGDGEGDDTTGRTAVAHHLSFDGRVVGLALGASRTQTSNSISAAGPLPSKGRRTVSVLLSFAEHGARPDEDAGCGTVATAKSAKLILQTPRASSRKMSESNTSSRKLPHSNDGKSKMKGASFQHGFAVLRIASVRFILLPTVALTYTPEGLPAPAQPTPWQASIRTETTPMPPRA